MGEDEDKKTVGFHDIRKLTKPSDWKLWNLDITKVFGAEGLSDYIDPKFEYKRLPIPTRELQSLQATLIDISGTTVFDEKRYSEDNTKHRAEFDRKASKAIRYLISGLSNEYEQCIDVTSTPADLYVEIRDMIRHDSFTEKQEVEADIKALQMRAEEDLVAYLARAKALWSRYLHIDYKIKFHEESFCETLLNGIPDRPPYQVEKSILELYAKLMCKAEDGARWTVNFVLDYFRESQAYVRKCETKRQNTRPQKA